MLGQGGTMEFVDAAVSGKVYDFVVVNSAGTLTVLTGSGSEDLLTAYNFSAKTISAGIVIAGRNGGKITAITPGTATLIGYTFL
jgi:3-hydroxyisobutyrate dehydrogenase-like beta-hydroxyacid dehydrogenase